MEKHIVAIGGGGFGRNIFDLKIEKYILRLANSKTPNICFLPTASGDNDSYKVSFYSAFSRLSCNPIHIDLFKRTIDLENQISKQDIIYVGGGNTKSMLSVWKAWGLDLILKRAYNSGVIMSGVSAGAICWFKSGISDSWQNDLSIIECLDFVDGICCPHYDEEKNRIPYVKRIIKKGIINNCVAIEGNCALHIKNGKFFKSLDFGKEKKSFFVHTNDSQIVHTPYDSEKL